MTSLSRAVDRLELAVERLLARLRFTTAAPAALPRGACSPARARGGGHLFDAPSSRSRVV